MRGHPLPGPPCPALTALGLVAGRSRRGVAPEGSSGGGLRIGRSTKEEIGLSEQRKYRTWTAQQKIEIVLAGLRGDRSVTEVCREHEISETLYYSWREKLLEGGRERLAGKEERTGETSCASASRELERALGRKTYELEIAGKRIAGVGVSVARRLRPRELVAAGHRPAAVARMLQISRQAIYRDPRAAQPPDAARRPPVDDRRAGDRRGRRGEPDRRLPDRHRLGQAQARAGGQPQARAAGDARAAS